GGCYPIQYSTPRLWEQGRDQIFSRPLTRREESAILHTYRKNVKEEAHGPQQAPRGDGGADLRRGPAALTGKGVREYHHAGHRGRSGGPDQGGGVPPLQVQGGDHGRGGGPDVPGK